MFNKLQIFPSFTVSSPSKPNNSPHFHSTYLLKCICKHSHLFLKILKVPSCLQIIPPQYFQLLFRKSAVLHFSHVQPLCTSVPRTPSQTIVCMSCYLLGVGGGSLPPPNPFFPFYLKCHFFKKPVLASLVVLVVLKSCFLLLFSVTY